MYQPQLISVYIWVKLKKNNHSPETCHLGNDSPEGFGHQASVGVATSGGVAIAGAPGAPGALATGAMGGAG